ncbi:MAG TPA: metalloregulator ArsR/SmtB family transcription factor [Gaiellaceae bacterium]|jgi:ArsR family transcriptional regulator
MATIVSSPGDASAGRALHKSMCFDTLTCINATEMTETLTPIACCAPLSAPALSPEEAEATADLFRALGDPARVRILNLLATTDEPVCVCHLVEPLGLSQPTVSHHLKKLLDAGLLAREQRGKWAYFSLRAEATERLASLADLTQGGL